MAWKEMRHFQRTDTCFLLPQMWSAVVKVVTEKWVNVINVSELSHGTHLAEVDFWGLGISCDFFFVRRLSLTS